MKLFVDIPTSNELRTIRGIRRERGAILIQTAIAMLGLLAFCALTIDYGVMWVARGQAQNAADAGALAGAIELAFGDAADTDHVKDVAIAAAQANTVFGRKPVIERADVTVGDCPEVSPGLPDTCVRVEVFCNSARGCNIEGDPLPMFFLPLVGVDGHGVRATAMAQVATSAKATCLKPWVVPDKWQDLLDTTTPVDTETTIDDTFDRYDEQGNNPQNWKLLSGTKDTYVPPSADDPGTGYRIPVDIGKRVTLKASHWNKGAIGPGNMQALYLENTACKGGGTDLHSCNIETCNPTPIGVGDIVETEPGNFGTPQVNALKKWLGDDTAVWECADGTPALPSENCVGAPSKPGSKKLVPIAAYDIQDFLESAVAGKEKANGRIDIRISRVLGFFIESYTNDEIIGRFAYYPSSSGELGNIEDSANFLRRVILVR